MLSGSILDVYSDHKKNMMITWLVNNGKTTKVEGKFEPSFYVYASSNELYALASILQDIPQVKKLNFTLEKISLGSEKKKFVLEVIPKTISSLSRLADMIDSWGSYYRYQLFNVDLRMPTRYLQSKGVFCNAYVKWNGKNFLCDEEQWSIDYKMPCFKKTHLSVKRKDRDKMLSFNDKVESFIFDDFIISEENEIDTIISAVKYVKKTDPDIIYTRNGDSILFPFLYHRAKIYGIQHLVNFGRDNVQHLNPVKKAKSYFSYGQILYRPAFYTLKGRVHIDSRSSFLFNESGLCGLIDISRCSNIPLQLLSRLGPGTAISQMQVNKAVEKEYLVPWKKNMPENWKTAFDILVCDRGGLILDPAVGLHEDVIELDYASLYPNVMLKFNISPETMLCSCCKDSPVHVPQLGYHICVKKKGLIVEVLKPIVYRRFCYKARSKNKKYDNEFYSEMQQAWKWILLVCFGYTGYRNARFGRLECYESITAFSRDILLTAVKTAEKGGYKVLHGIIDSLWIKPNKSCIKPFQLSRMISKHAGVRMDVEGHYKWIVFLPCKEMDVGALNRYYGVFDNGELKVRGIEFRQKNTTKFLKNIQYEMLKIFSQANNRGEFLEKIPVAIQVLKDYGRKIIKEDVDRKDLIIKNRVSRDIFQYKVNNLVKSALLQLRDLGIKPEPGQSISYIVKNENAGDYRKRVCIVENLSQDEEIDVDFYLRQIAMCGESILVPFGYSKEKLENMLQKIKYREKMNVSVLPRIRTSQTSM